MPEPVVSVLMSVNNGARHLGPALESIRAQEFSGFEFLVIDDASTDATPELLKSAAQVDSRVRMVRQDQRSGLTRSLNRGLGLVRGRYVARMDADDIAGPERLGRQVAFLDAAPEVVVVGSQIELIDDVGRPLGRLEVPLGHEAIDGAHIEGHAGRLIHPAVMLRTEALRQVGGYREDLATAQDFDLWLRLGEKGRLANLDRSLLSFRQHLRSVSVARRAQQARDLRRCWQEARQRRGLPVLEELPQDQRDWLAAGTSDTRAWWVTTALGSRHLRSAWVHAWRLWLAEPLRKRSWHLLRRVILVGLKASLLGRILRRP